VSLLRQLLERKHAQGVDSPAGVADRRAAHDVAHQPEKLAAEASTLAKAGQPGHALRLVTDKLASQPRDAELLFARGLVLAEWGRLREALDSFGAAEAQGLSHFGLRLNLAQTCHMLGLAGRAEENIRAAVALEPLSAAAHLGLGAILQARKRLADAISSYEQAHALEPDRADCLVYIAACRLDEKDAHSGELAARKAIALDEELAMAWGVLGTALAHQDDCPGAMAAFERAEAIEARTEQTSETFVVHGFHLLGFGMLDEALDLYARYLPSSPHPVAHAHYGWTLLTAGRLREGWIAYEFRWWEENLLATRRHLGRPQWNGQDLRGKTLVLWPEQGVGDTVQFVRYATVLKARGASVVLLARDNLKSMSKYFAGVDRVVSDPSQLKEGFDYHIPTMSVPSVLGTSLNSIPAEVPYLSTDPVRAERWRQRLASDQRLKVGLVWAGNPRHERDRFRSMSLSALDRVLAIENIGIYSLQKERSSRDVETLSRRGVVDLATEITDFCETAAAIQAMDLVVTVDTAVAHVAGALGKPVWILLPAAGDFRWLKGREDSPWYPTMRLFTQKRLGAWDEVVERLALALRDAVSARERGALREALLPPSGPADIGGTPEAELPKNSIMSRLTRVTQTRHGFIQYAQQPEAPARSLECYGEWLQSQLDLIHRLVGPGSVVVEAGAGIGLSALSLARHLGPKGHLIAYENDANLRRILRQNLQMNRLSGLVTVMPRGLGSPAMSNGTPREGIVERSHDADNAASCDALDDLLLPRLDLLKIGADAEAKAILSGAQETIWRLRPRLFIGASTALLVGELAEQVKAFGYRCWDVRSPLYNPSNFNCRLENVFSDLTSSALAAVPEELAVEVQGDGCVEIE
jgi:FkbM family methyltransferase